MLMQNTNIYIKTFSFLCNHTSHLFSVFLSHSHQITWRNSAKFSLKISSSLPLRLHVRFAFEQCNIRMKLGMQQREYCCTWIRRQPRQPSKYFTRKNHVRKRTYGRYEVGRRPQQATAHPIFEVL